MTVYTRTQLTSDSGDRFGVKPSLIVLHHTALVGSIQSLINLMMPGGRTVSAHAAIRDNDIVNVVPESRRSFSLGAAVFERRVLSAECINSTGGPAWLLSDATHESIARWVADVCKRYGIRPHREGPPSSWTVIGHREVSTIHQAGYGTACPGGMRVDWIVARAQKLLNPTFAANPLTSNLLTVTAPLKGDDMTTMTIHHQVNTNGGQAYIAEGAFGFQIVSRDWALAILKPQSIDIASLKQINEFDYAGMAQAKARDVAMGVSAIAAAVALAIPASAPASGSGPTVQQIAEATQAILADEFAAVQANVDEIPLGFNITAK